MKTSVAIKVIYFINFIFIDKSKILFFLVFQMLKKKISLGHINFTDRIHLKFNLFWSLVNSPLQICLLAEEWRQNVSPCDVIGQLQGQGKAKAH